MGDDLVEVLDAVKCDLLPYEVSCSDLDTDNDPPVAMTNRNLHTNAKKNRYPILHGEALLASPLQWSRVGGNYDNRVLLLRLVNS